MSKVLNIIKSIIFYAFQFSKYIIGFCFLGFVIVFWRLYVEETSWGFSKLPAWMVYLATIIIFLPWEILYELRKTSVSSAIKTKVESLIEVFISLKNGILSVVTNRDFLTRLGKAVLFLVMFMVIAEEFVVREYTTSTRILTIWRNFKQSPGYPIWNFDNMGVRPDYVRAFIYYLIGMIVVRQGGRYIFFPQIKRKEQVIVKRLEEIFYQPNTTKLISYFLLTSIVLVFISYILGQGSYSLVIASPREDEDTTKNLPVYLYPTKEEVVAVELTIQNFDVENPRIDGVLSISEKEHTYQKGGCNDDFYNSECDEETGFPLLFFDQENIVVNGKELPIIITEKNEAGVNKKTAIATDQEFTSRPSGNNYFFPFNEYTANITVSENNLWNYAAIDISTSHRFFSIYPEYEKNSNFTNTNTFYYRIGYAPYYKILVVIIFFALFSFLWVIWHTTERGTLIELSVGVFATIITMRGFLIPQEFSTDPIFLDQVLLVYIALFLFILMFKHESIKENNRF